MSDTDIDEITQNKIDKILRQTDYTKDIIIQKLEEYKGNEIEVIKSYLRNETIEVAIVKPIISPHQEIYHQIRSHLNQPNKSANYLSYKTG